MKLTNSPNNMFTLMEEHKDKHLAYLSKAALQRGSYMCVCMNLARMDQHSYLRSFVEVLCNIFKEQNPAQRNFLIKKPIDKL